VYTRTIAVITRDCRNEHNTYYHYHGAGGVLAYMLLQ